MATCLSHDFVLSFLSKDFSFATTNKVSPCNLAPSASPIKKRDCKPNPAPWEFRNNKELEHGWSCHPTQRRKHSELALLVNHT